jgi:hypothetical protein
MRVKRTKGLSTKLTPVEYAALEALAGTEPTSAWAREQLLGLTARRPVEETLVSELLALRTIVLNLQVAHLRGDRLTTEMVQQLIDRADQEKLRKARERLGLDRRGTAASAV